MEWLWFCGKAQMSPLWLQIGRYKQFGGVLRENQRWKALSPINTPNSTQGRQIKRSGSLPPGREESKCSELICFYFQASFFVPNQPGNLRSRIIFWTLRIRTAWHQFTAWTEDGYEASYFHETTYNEKAMVIKTIYNETAMVIKSIYNEKATVMTLLTMKGRWEWNYFQWKDDGDETTHNEKLMVMKLLTMKSWCWWNYTYNHETGFSPLRWPNSRV